MLNKLRIYIENSVIGGYFDKEFVIEDCVKFKHDLHEKAFKASGAKSMREYIDYVNKAFLKSEWCKNSNIE
jgi:hypothetical protein